MKGKRLCFQAIITILLVACAQTTISRTVDQDLTTICSWYKSLATDEEFKSFTVEDKYAFAFNKETRANIKNKDIQMFYSALRGADSKQRYELFKSYAEEATNQNWECAPMREIMNEFIAIDPLYQSKSSN